MSHVRTQIRDAAAALLDNLATTGTMVFKSRVHPVGTDELPCLLVYCDDEPSIDQVTLGNPSRLQRELVLIVKGLVKSNAALDENLDKICSEVEVAVASNVTLGGLVRMGVYLRSVRVGLSGDLETPCGEIMMEFAANYSTNSNAPEVSL